jgi:hypothetical protein
MSRRVKAPWVAAAVVALASCSDDKPVDSTPPEAPPPAPAATAVAAPAGTPLPGTSCNVPAVSKPADRCLRETQGDFVLQVDAAIQKLMAEQPDIFSGEFIRDIPRYRVGVTRNLEAAGLCVQWDDDRNGHRELMVKNTNSYSEQYHIEVSSGEVRMGNGAYRATCYPANFPVNPEPLGQRGDCRLPSSRDYGCTRTGNPQFVGLMDEVVNEVSRERPDLVRDGWLVGSWSQYEDAVVQKLLGRGYCAVFHIEEVSVKNTNDFSEQYKLAFSWGQLRRASDSWRATCRPATF